MRGLTYQERRALVVDPPDSPCSQDEEWLPDFVFNDVIARGLAVWRPVNDEQDQLFTTELGEIALRCCPPSEGP